MRYDGVLGRQAQDLGEGEEEEDEAEDAVFEEDDDAGPIEGAWGTGEWVEDDGSDLDQVCPTLACVFQSRVQKDASHVGGSC